MGLFDSVARAMGSLRSLSDEELKEAHEEVRLRYVASDGVKESTRLYNELHRIDAE